ncbi:MAG: DUF362 domain-containing protein [Candidatus Eisenbacteria bacterium]|nr:DUF362 domain-containing protein [Candidatus Eisenbacteria bacterium]
MKSQVHIERCPDYSEAEVRAAVRKGLEALGGLKRLVKPGWRVLLKPNLLSARPPERAVTTHPSLIAVLAREVKACGAVPFLGDSSAGALKGVSRVYKNTGMEDVCNREGVEIVGFEVAGIHTRTLNGRTYTISRPVLDADFVINVPKLKTHTLEVYTGAIKNMFGAIPGLAKAGWHKAHPKPDEFAEVLVDVFSLTKPGLNVMDAIVAMEGPGPSSGTPRQMGLVLFSTDGLAMDVVACEIIGAGAGEVPTNRVAAERKLGASVLTDIQVTGADLAEVSITDFEIPSNFLHRLVPRGLLGILRRHIWIHPRADRADCKLCNMCVEGCPVGAITNTGSALHFDYAKCVTCLCCHEICPHDAIEFDMSWLARRIT